jgi:antitoxin CptB
MVCSGTGKALHDVLGVGGIGIKDTNMETAEAKLKRMKMRSWRRGTKEMDMILGPFADAHLGDMGPQELTLYDGLLDENDQDLLPWVLGQMPAPSHLVDLIAKIGTFARGRLLRS